MILKHQTSIILLITLTILFINPSTIIKADPSNETESETNGIWYQGEGWGGSVTIISIYIEENISTNFHFSFDPEETQFDFQSLLLNLEKYNDTIIVKIENQSTQILEKNYDRVYELDYFYVDKNGFELPSITLNISTKNNTPMFDFEGKASASKNGYIINFYGLNNSITITITKDKDIPYWFIFGLSGIAEISAITLLFNIWTIIKKRNIDRLTTEFSIVIGISSIVLLNQYNLEAFCFASAWLPVWALFGTIIYNWLGQHD